MINGRDLVTQDCARVEARGTVEQAASERALHSAVASERLAGEASRRSCLVVRRASAIDRIVNAIAQGFTTELDAVGVVNDAVEDGVGEGRIADDVVPLRDGNLTGDRSEWRL